MQVELLRLETLLEQEEDRCADLNTRLAAAEAREVELAAELASQEQLHASAIARLQQQAADASADFCSRLKAAEERETELAAELREAEVREQSLAAQVCVLLRMVVITVKCELPAELREAECREQNLAAQYASQSGYIDF